MRAIPCFCYLQKCLALYVSSDNERPPELSPGLTGESERENPGLLYVSLNLGGSAQSEHGSRPEGRWEAT